MKIVRLCFSITVFSLILPSLSVRADESCGSIPDPSHLSSSGECKLDPKDSTFSPTVKGYCIFSWKAKTGKKEYALVPGYNRSYYSTDLDSGKCSSFKELKEKLEQLPEGQNVTWMKEKTSLDESVKIQMAKPSSNELKEVQQVLKKKKAKLTR